MINPISFTPNNKLSIFHINDLHGQTDNLQAIVGASQNFDKKDGLTTDKLKLSGGDNVSGADKTKNQMIAGFLNALGIDFSAIGNHEFDDGVNSFADFLNKTKTKFVCANIEVPNSNPIKNKITNSAIKEINGTKYGIVGLTTPELQTVSKNKEILGGIEVEDIEESAEKIQEEVNKLQQQGINRIILLPHAGYDFDKEFAKMVDGIDIVISGHSHDAIEGAVEGENLLKSKTNEPVLVVQAGDNGRYYGICDVEFDNKGRITKVNNQLNKTSAQKSPAVEYIKNAYMGPSPTVASINEIDPLPKNKRISACGWSNLICDGMKNEMDSDIAFMNSANIRKVPPTGILSERDVFETTPMKNELITIKMSEKEIVDALKYASKSIIHPTGEPGLLQVSGLNYSIDTNGNLLDLNFVDKKGAMRKIDINNPNTEQKYKATIDSFTFDGREYPPLKLQNREFQKFAFDKDKTAVSHIRKLTDNGKKPLSVKDDGRLKIVQTSKPQLSSNSMQSFLKLTSPKSS